MIELLEGGKVTDINLKEAIHYLALAWRSISSATIENFCKHTGLIQMQTEDASQQLEDPVCELDALLRRPTLACGNSMSTSSYLDIDETVDTGELPTEDDILDLVSGKGVCTDNDEPEDEPDEDDVPTVKEAREAARVLQKYFDSKSDGDCSWTVTKLTSKLEVEALKSIRRTSLLNYFSNSGV